MGDGVGAAWDAEEFGQKAKSAARGALRWGRWPAADSRGGQHGEGGFCVSVPGLQRRRRQRWERRWPGKGAGVGSLPALAAAAAAASAGQPRVCVPRGFSSWLKPPRVEAGKARGAGARPQPTCPLACLARGSGAPGTTRRPAEMTRGLLPPKISLRSPRVRGARSKSPPPARRRAVPPPRTDSPARETCARACAGARPGPEFYQTGG